MSHEPLPASVLRLLWDVEPSEIDFDRDRALIFERVMTSGTWQAMQWLRERYRRDVLAEFVAIHGRQRLSPRDLAYWSLVTDVEASASAGGGRPRWAGT